MSYRIEMTVVDPAAAKPDALNNAFVFSVSMDATRASLVEVQRTMLEALTKLNADEVEACKKRNY